MKGQWIGSIEGTNTGTIVLNIDHDRPDEGWFMVDDSIHPFYAYAKLAVNENNVEGLLSDWRAEPYIGQTQASSFVLPTAGSFSGTVRENTFSGSWQTDSGTSGTFNLAERDSSVVRNSDMTLSWTEFVSWATDECSNNKNLIFRGQASAEAPLTTLFHRKGRRCLQRYDSDDVRRLQRYVESVLSKRFDLADPFQYGAFLNLAQHHGFPTPLLDWTESPFIAVFFAFRQKRTTHGGPLSEAPTRVFVFDQGKLNRKNVASIGDVRLAFEPLRLGAADNPRALPQQSVNVFSNVVDIEGFIERTQIEGNALRRVDIPFSERSLIIRSLKLMGVTAASLFPGLDGTCEALSEDLFSV